MKKIRIKDVAKQAGVSNATVSRALNQKHLVNPETYSKILDAMHSLGYKPIEIEQRFTAETMSRLVIIDIPTFENPFYRHAILAAETIASKYNYVLLVNSSGFNSLLSFCREAKIGGIVTLSGYSAAQLNQLSDLCQVVQCCEFCDGYPLPYVSIDDYKATKEALNYLLSLGKKKFSFINLSNDYKFAIERKKAFNDFLMENGLERYENFIIELPNFDYHLSISAIENLLSKEDRPDAIFSVSDVFATAAIKIATNLNISIPEELAIIGFDNLPLGQVISPSLTTIKQPLFTMASMACEFLFEKIRKPDIPNKQYLLETKLVIRESTERGQVDFQPK